MEEKMIIFVISLLVMLVIVIFSSYYILTKTTDRKINQPKKQSDKEYLIKDYESANAKLFGIKNNNDDLDKTQVFTPINEEYLKKYYNTSDKLFNDNENDDLPKLKQK